MEIKKCSCCNLEKSFDNYNKQKNGKYGLRSKCNSCVKTYRQEYMKRPEAKESHRIRAQKWRDENPEEQLKRSREQFKKHGHIYSANAKEKYNTNEEYRLKKLEIDKQYSATGRRKELYAIPENRIKGRLRAKKYHEENKDKESEYNKKYIENLSDTLVKHRMGYKESDIIPQELIETKRLTIQLKRQLKNN